MALLFEHYYINEREFENFVRCRVNIDLNTSAASKCEILINLALKHWLFVYQKQLTYAITYDIFVNICVCFCMFTCPAMKINTFRLIGKTSFELCKHVTLSTKKFASIFSSVICISPPSTDYSTRSTRLWWRLPRR